MKSRRMSKVSPPSFCSLLQGCDIAQILSACASGGSLSYGDDRCITGGGVDADFCFAESLDGAAAGAFLGLMKSAHSSSVMNRGRKIFPLIHRYSSSCVLSTSTMPATSFG